MSSADPAASRVVGTVFGLTDRGNVRAENQDSFLVADLAGADAEALVLFPEVADGPGALRTLRIAERGLLLIVADGMGGAAGGAVASRLAVAGIFEWLYRHWSRGEPASPQQFARRLCEAVEHAHQRVHSEAARRPELRGMGTTATVAGVLDDVLYLAQVGDSRAYLLRGGCATQLTRDQSYVQTLVEAGQLTMEQAEQSAYSSLILQALGTQERLEVDLTSQALRRGDTLLLCSDGLTRLVRGAELCGIVDRAADLAAAGRELMRQAKLRGAPDNVTVVLLRLEGEGLRPPAPSDAVGRFVLARPA